MQSIISPPTTSKLPRILILLLIILIVPPPTTPDWTSDCTTRYPASCRCTWSSGKRLASCEKSNLNVIPTLSHDIQILDLSNNKLNSLQDNAFTITNLINLQKLYLRSSRISRIHPLAFNNLRILVEMDLSHNDLETLDPQTFSTNVRIRIIKLNNNKLTHITPEFPPLDHLNTIDLSHNQIQNISDRLFTSLRNLKVLDLSHNNLQNLSPTYLPRLSSLGLRGNSWVCDCTLSPLRDYVISHKFLEPEVRCTEPLTLFNSMWDAFPDLSCRPEIVHILANNVIVESIVALVQESLVLSCVVRGDPLPDVKWVRGGRVVQDVVGDINTLEHTVTLNLTIGGASSSPSKSESSEFVCVGSNSGGVVERNLTISVDSEGGLSGFVLFKDGNTDLSPSSSSTTNGDSKPYRMGMLIYAIIGIVFLSLIVGLVVGGVCVWRWGRGGPNANRSDGVEHDSVVKGVIMKVGGGGGAGNHPNIPNNNDRMGGDGVEERGVLLRGEGGGGDGSNRDGEFMMMMTDSNQHLYNHNNHHYHSKSAENLLGSRALTPDLLHTATATTPHDNDNDYEANFPDTSSLYDNVIHKPIILPALPRRLMLRDYSNYYGITSPVQRPSSVCSEPRGVVNSGTLNRFDNSSNHHISIVPHGYVTLPRNKGAAKRPIIRGEIKYDNLGERTTADGSSRRSLNTMTGYNYNNNPADNNELINNGTLLPNSMAFEDAPPLPSLPPLPPPPLFEPIIEVTNEDDQLNSIYDTKTNKFKPVPPPKPKKKKPNVVVEGEDEELNSNAEEKLLLKNNDDDEKEDDADDGTEV